VFFQDDLSGSSEVVPHHSAQELVDYQYGLRKIVHWLPLFLLPDSPAGYRAGVLEQGDVRILLQDVVGGGGGLVAGDQANYLPDDCD